MSAPNFDCPGVRWGARDDRPLPHGLAWLGGVPRRRFRPPRRAAADERLGGAARGLPAFRSLLTGVSLSIITQSMPSALLLRSFRHARGFRGHSRLTDLKTLLGFTVQDPATRLALYAISVAALGAAFLLCRFITTSKLGRVLLALRDAESRVRFLGYSVTHAKLFVFTVSAVLAGVAAALYVPQRGIIHPSEFSPANSIEIAIWVAVAARATLPGAILGSVI